MEKIDTKYRKDEVNEEKEARHIQDCRNAQINCENKFSQLFEKTNQFHHSQQSEQLKEIQIILHVAVGFYELIKVKFNQ